MPRVQSSPIISAFNKEANAMKYFVIPSSIYQRDDGKTASIYGAVPWQSDAERDRWSIVNKGYTVQNPLTGQIGIGAKPWATREEAEAYANMHRPSSIGIGG